MSLARLKQRELDSQAVTKLREAMHEVLNAVEQSAMLSLQAGSLLSL